MTSQANPDLFHTLDVPDRIRPYVRRVLMADADQAVDFEIDVRATGYHYFCWSWRGSWQGIVDGKVVFDTDLDGMISLSGQIDKSAVTARFQRDVGQVFLEFTALGHYQLLGITGARMFEDAAAPQLMNTDLAQYFGPLLQKSDQTPESRVELLADVLDQLPRHTVIDGMMASIDMIEAADGNIRIADITSDLCMADRQFRTNFKALVGLTPKTFCKTLQINRAFNQLLSNNGGDLAGIAVQSGFSDQAHFTRAFSKFLGKAPKIYLENVETTLEKFVGQSRRSRA